MEHGFRIAMVGVAVALGFTGCAGAAVEDAAATIKWTQELGLVWVVVGAQVLVALVAIGLAAERLVRSGRSRVAPPGLLADVRAKGAAGDWDGVLAAASGGRSLLADAVVFVAEHRFNEVAHIQQAAAARARRAGEGQLQRAWPIAAAGWSGALLGLLGTVLGMVAAFGVAAGQPGAAPAGPFAAALVPAALAMTLAIPVLLLQAWAESAAWRRAGELAAAVDALIDDWFLKPEGEARRKAREDEAREREALRQAMRVRGASSKGGVAAARSSS